MNKKVLLITGGSSGIGLATANLFANKGYRVYELSRSGRNGNQIMHIDCDVTDEQQVLAATEDVIRREGRVDVLISNAGYGISGPVEFTDTADAKRQFDVNFFGSLNVVKAVLPKMRSQQCGTIIFVSSVAAVLSIPYQSFYSASKSAINALALALRNEVEEFGIKISVLMPGDVSTGFTDARKKTIVGENVYNHAHKAVAIMEKDERNGMSCEYLAKQLYNVSTKRNPKPLYTAGLQYKVFVILEKLLPKRLTNKIVGNLYK